MARRPATPPPKQPARLTPDEKRRAIPRLEKRIAELRALDPTAIEDRWHDPRVTALSQAIDRSLVETFGGDTLDYRRYRRAAELDRAPTFASSETPLPEVREGFRRGITDAIATLEGVIAGFHEDLEEADAQPAAPASARQASRRVFVVHGHDEAARETMARFLERLKLDAVILHEQPNQGLTIIEKFEVHAAQVGFAVVLLTPDDLGEAQAGGTVAPRARQNGVFELGYFAGKIGRGKVCLLRKGEIEGFSDFHGVVYTTMDAGGGWKLELARELKAAGFDVDLNKAFGG
jgi:predicted nucleotide-binding protein